MTEVWHIDVIDPGAGLGFASRRSPDLLSGSALPDEMLTAFIGPPAFAPEFVGARSVGLRFARGSGQIGLFRQEPAVAEVAFKNLGAVAEFMRRVYLRSGAGNGPEEGGTLLPEQRGEGPPPPFADFAAPEPPPHEPKPDVDFYYALLEVAHVNFDTIDSLKPDESKTASRLHLSAANPINAHRLARGALRVFLELARRTPASSSSPEYETWFEIANRLWVMVLRMGLLPLVAYQLWSDKRIAEWLAKQETIAGKLLDLFPDPNVKPEFPPPRFLSSLDYTDDAFANLARLPVPPELVGFLPPNSTSLQALLSAFVAVPTELIARKHEQEAIAELVLFAAACLNLGTETSALPFSGYWTSKYLRVPPLLVSRAANWLRFNLPNLVYDRKVEEMIANAAMLGNHTAPIRSARAF